MPHTSKPSGRRPGKSTAKTEIILAAQQLFADKGFSRTTIRQIADAAQVDPALVLHYFSSKQALFVDAMLPLYKAPQMLSEVLATEAPIGDKLARLFCTLLDDPETVLILLGIARAAASEPEAAAMMNKFVSQNIMQPLMQSMPSELDSKSLRASMIGATFVGLVMTRYIIKLEPLASATSQELLPLIGPALQSYFSSTNAAS